MNKTNSVQKIIIILLLSVALLLSIGAIIKTAMILAKINEPIQDAFGEMYSPSSKELFIPSFYLVLSILLFLIIATTLFLVITYKTTKILKIITYINLAIFALINFVLLIIEIAEQDYTLTYAVAGLNTILLNIPLLLNISPALLITENKTEQITEKNNTDNNDNKKESTDIEESLMQEEIAKLKHQLKLKQLEEEYLELKKQLEPKTKAKTTKKETE